MVLRANGQNMQRRESAKTMRAQQGTNHQIGQNGAYVQTQQQRHDQTGRGQQNHHGLIGTIVKAAVHCLSRPRFICASIERGWLIKQHAFEQFQLLRQGAVRGGHGVNFAHGMEHGCVVTPAKAAANFRQ